MISRITFIFIILTGMLLIPGVLGAENRITRGGTVYIGEGDLDLSDCNVRTGDEIAWWDSGNTEGTPGARARIADVRKFTVDPQTFRGHTGNWYGLMDKKLVFTVEEPFLQFDVVENGIDTEPDVIKRGNLVSFKISTNLAGVSKRTGSSGALVTIWMNGPNETEYHTLSSTRTGDFNVDKVYVYTTPYDTGVVWDTKDEEEYPDGEYTFSAMTNTNRIHEIFDEAGISYTENKTYVLSKTGKKPAEDEDEEEDTKSGSRDTKSEDKDKLSAEATGTIKSEETPGDEKSEESENSIKKKKDTEETDEPTPEETSEGKKNKKVSETDEPTPKETEDEPVKEDTIPITPSVTEMVQEENTPEITEEPTPTPTEEPTAVITPRASRTPLPRPPGPGASPTNASPLPAGLIPVAFAAAGILTAIRRR